MLRKTFVTFLLCFLCEVIVAETAKEGVCYQYKKLVWFCFCVSGTLVLFVWFFSVTKTVKVTKAVNYSVSIPENFAGITYSYKQKKICCRNSTEEQVLLYCYKEMCVL